MVDGTPVLDIKPYIPQYDYPGIANLTIRENCDRNNMLTSNIGNSDTDPHTDDILESFNERVMDGEENSHTSSNSNLIPRETTRYGSLLIFFYFW